MEVKVAEDDYLVVVLCVDVLLEVSAERGNYFAVPGVVNVDDERGFLFVCCDYDRSCIAEWDV